MNTDINKTEHETDKTAKHRSLTRSSLFDPQVGYEVDKVAWGQVFSGNFYFPTSVSSHQSSTLIFHLTIASAE